MPRSVPAMDSAALVHLAGAARVARLGAVVANLEARRAELLAAVEVVLGGV